MLWHDYLMGYGLCILFHEKANQFPCTAPATTTPITTTPTTTAVTGSYESCKAAGVVQSFAAYPYAQGGLAQEPSLKA